MRGNGVEIVELVFERRAEGLETTGTTQQSLTRRPTGIFRPFVLLK